VFFLILNDPSLRLTDCGFGMILISGDWESALTEKKKATLRTDVMVFIVR
jgi:hypothetical protein